MERLRRQLYGMAVLGKQTRSRPRPWLTKSRLKTIFSVPSQTLINLLVLQMKENVLKNSDEINFRVQDSSIRKSETNLETTYLKICSAGLG